MYLNLKYAHKSLGILNQIVVLCRYEVRQESPAFLRGKKKKGKSSQVVSVLVRTQFLLFVNHFCFHQQKFPDLESSERASRWPRSSLLTQQEQNGHSKKQALLFRSKNMCLRSLQKFLLRYPSGWNSGSKILFILFGGQNESDKILSWRAQTEFYMWIQSKQDLFGRKSKDLYVVL